jgi:6-phosphofructokinase 1
VPEIPYETEKVLDVINKRNADGKGFTIIAISEGAMTTTEMNLPKKERKSMMNTAGARLADNLQAALDEQGNGQDVKLVIPGYYQRGGEPTPTDRMICSRLGAKAAELVANRRYGYMAALRGVDIVAVPLSDVAGKLKEIVPDSPVIRQAKHLGISFGAV